MGEGQTVAVGDKHADAVQWATNFVASGLNELPDDKLDYVIGVLLNRIRDQVHARNLAKGWWNDKSGNNMLDPTYDQEKFAFLIGTKIGLVHSEASEMMEGFRVDGMDDKLPHRRADEVENVDVFLRIFDIAGALNHDLGGAYIEKVAYNAVRADHTAEGRAKKGGKKF